MNAFFKPSDITTRICTVNNKTKGGSAFAICENNEQVFISPKIVDATGIDVGDMLTAYCVDNHRDAEGEARFSVRWRAIRITIRERFQPVAVVPQPAPAQTTPEGLPERCRLLLQQDRAWTSRQMADALGVDIKAVSNWLVWQSRGGHITAIKAYADASQHNPSHVWYVRNMDLAKDLIDEVTLED